VPHHVERLEGGRHLDAARLLGLEDELGRREQVDRRVVHGKIDAQLARLQVDPPSLAQVLEPQARGGSSHVDR